MSRCFQLLAVATTLLAIACAPQVDSADAGPAAPTAAPPTKPAVEPTVVRAAAGPTRHALLVACSIYPGLDARYHLKGPPHDVPLLAGLLQRKFQLAPGNIRQLVDGQSSDQRPTRANILREFDRLAEVAKSGDQVVIMLGGHGSQQPNNNPGSPDDSEPDGMDEVFLPVDFEPRFDEAKKSLVNAISDDEIGRKLTAIRATGAFVWIIFDCCHSGTMTRGTETQSPRHIALDDLQLPASVLATIRPEAPPAGARGGPDPEDTPIETAGTGKHGGLAAIYAALPTEKTYDDSFPPDAPPSQQVRHGILTYAICQILERATEPLTYKELVLRVRQQYAQWRRANGPTPLVDGPDREVEIFGEKAWPGRSAMQLKVDGGRMTVNAGGLQGLAVGAVLAVLPAAGQGTEPVGYVKVESCRVLESTVSPVPFAGMPVATKLASELPVRVERVDFGLRKLRVAEDAPAGARGAPLGLAALLKAESASREVVEVVADPTQADWLVRVDGDKGYLIPASGWTGTASERGVGVPDKQFGPIPTGEQLGPRLSQVFAAIARAQNLLALSEPVDGERLSGSLRVELQLSKHRDEDDEKGERVDLSRGKLALQPGELLGYHIINQGRKAVDVTLLFVDGGFGIKAWYPRDGELNRLAPGESLGPPDINFAQVNIKTTGLEHMVLIAAAASDAPLDFSWLAQPTLAAARAVPGVERSGTSPLGQLLQSAAYAPTTRDVEPVQVRQSCIRTVSWKVEPPPAK
ncbi:MAG: caspase family protein [Pirellulaceae bacterium]|nr:caspase family protein [Pirellulaceae bacterium]